MFSVIIVANGKSVRFKKNKLLVKVGNEILINETISCFENIKNINEIIVVCEDEILNFIKNKNIIQVNGGNSRSQSVKKGLEKVSNDFVLIHDGARPFVPKNLISKIILNLKNYDCVVPTINITNCLKKIVNNKIITVNRNEYFESQTPQGFKTQVIKEAYKNNNNIYFDDCQVIEELNCKIKLIKGDVENIKITYPKDIK